MLINVDFGSKSKYLSNFPTLSIIEVFLNNNNHKKIKQPLSPNFCYISSGIISRKPNEQV